MTIYFIRHAEAVEKEFFNQDDMERPLTKKGKKSFKKFFSKISKNLDKPDIIVSSEAKRAKETAKIVSKCFKSEYITDPSLNPGSDSAKYRQFLKDLEDKNFEVVAIVSHEPDLTDFITSYLGKKENFLKMKKGAVCIIKDKVLYSLIQPDNIL